MGSLAANMHEHVALQAEGTTIYLTVKEGGGILTYIATLDLTRIGEPDAHMPTRQLVAQMNLLVASAAQSGLVGGAEEDRGSILAHVADRPHLFPSLFVVVVVVVVAKSLVPAKQSDSSLRANPVHHRHRHRHRHRHLLLRLLFICRPLSGSAETPQREREREKERKREGKDGSAAAVEFLFLFEKVEMMENVTRSPPLLKLPRALCRVPDT